MKDMKALLKKEVMDLYDAEQQLIKALPKMAKAANSEKLRDALEKHLDVTKSQKERLEKVFELMDEKPEAETCDGMKGLIKEGEKVIKEKGDIAVKDAALIASAQKVEHYEIAGYGSAAAFAEELGMEEVKEILGSILEEEEKADRMLNTLAMEEINRKAVA